MIPNSRATQILKFLYLQKRKVTASEITKVVNIDYRQIYTSLRILLAMGVVKNINIEKQYYYYIPIQKREEVMRKLERIENERRNELNRE